MALGDNIIAAAPDFPFESPATVSKRFTALEISPDHLYVNAGVLLIDVAKWRRRNSTQRLLQYIENRGPALTFHDQDAINAVLQDEIKIIDPRWNLQARMYRLGRRSFPDEFAATREARRGPAIIHYTTSKKPWLFRSRTPRRKEYFRYLDKTAWRHARPELATGRRRAEYWLDRQMSRIGIDYLYIVDAICRKCKIVLAQLTAVSQGVIEVVRSAVRAARP